MPEDYEKECYEKKAIRRKRTIKNPLDLIVLLLYYLYDNHSLVDVSGFAILKNIGKISDTALTFNLYNQDGEKILLSDWLGTISEKAEELTVYVKDSNKNFIPLRICAVKKTKEETATE